jgi:hypothetical protein
MVNDFKEHLKMSKKSEIIFMQTRLIRLAAQEWKLSIEKVIDIFKKAKVLGYIEDSYGIFHCEGDGAVLEDVSEFVRRKGIQVNA